MQTLAHRPPNDLSTEAIQQQLEALLASPEFAPSPQLSALFRYVVETALTGDPERLKETAIGLEVFNRPPDYDPKIDPIVRVEARRLRAKLDIYYRRRGHLDPLWITLPKGAYLPAFEAKVEAIGEAGDSDGDEYLPHDPLDADDVAPSVADATQWWVRTRFRTWAQVAVAALAAVLMIGGIAAVWNVPSQRPTQAFWSALLGGPQPTILVPADSGLVMLENLSERSIPLREYMTGEYLEHPAASDQPATPFGGRRYTSIVDLEFAARIAAHPELKGSGLSVRFARDLRLDDLSGSNLIFLGAKHSNPWIELYEDEASLRIDHDEANDEFRIINISPLKGEQPEYRSWASDPQQTVYGLITFHSSSDGSGHVLTVGGTTMAGTEAAADFVLSEERMRPFLEQVWKDGGLRGFDLLVQSRNLGGSAHLAEVVVFHPEIP